MNQFKTRAIEFSKHIISEMMKLITFGFLVMLIGIALGYGLLKSVNTFSNFESKFIVISVFDKSTLNE